MKISLVDVPITIRSIEDIACFLCEFGGDLLHYRHGNLYCINILPNANHISIPLVAPRHGNGAGEDMFYLPRTQTQLHNKSPFPAPISNEDEKLNLKPISIGFGYPCPTPISVVESIF